MVDRDIAFEAVKPQPGLIGAPDLPAAAADERMAGQLGAAVGDAMRLAVGAAAIERPWLGGDTSSDEAPAGRGGAVAARSEGRRGGEECVSMCGSRCSTST